MRSLRRIALMATKWSPRPLMLTLALFLLTFVNHTFAQQPAVGRQKSPRLTTEDVARPPVEPHVAESKEPTAKSPEDVKSGASETNSGQPKAGEKKVSEEESSWRDRARKARERARESERAAENAELRITALRNDLAVSGQSARYRNETAAELDQAGQTLIELRAQARDAADDLGQLVEYGREKGFAEAAEPKATDEGKPNEQYYIAKLAKLKEAMESARRRIQLYENRVRDISQRILLNGGKGGGDNFYTAQLQQERDDAQQKLDEANAALSKAQIDRDTLMEEARRAGVPPGLFR